MSLPHRSRSSGVVVALLMVAWTGVMHAQGRPAGSSPRVWLEVGLSAAAQANRCVTCTPATIGGGSATAAAGVTLPDGFGVGLLGRAFNQFDLESPSLQSRYVIAFAQYAPPGVSFLTLNLGLGQGRHSSSEPSLASSSGSGTVFYVGTALRLPPRSALAVSVTADVVQSIDGTPQSHPRLLSVGLSLGAATPSPTPAAP